ncbi:MerR family transcriptional regulator [Clostridium ljungdahlii]|uniref:HTH-type transcriptional activator mta n=1 Tax=Clostridium ljungdahlii TaxID=1538 RepID=A0A168RAD8_9CLOT|nr:MerR family transcriptional regulator [Clostridium ljungdahlii]OAA90440.1 HTH-type transcriptional activator mta [Clostridium ljungdahlii]
MKKYLSISQMAEIHNISRQTLIYYDKIGLFKPTYIDDKGYRYYSPYQIPFLREICFLKSTGIKLKDIKNNIKDRNINKAISLLKSHKELIDKEIDKLLLTRDSIEERLNLYSNADQFKDELYKPIIEKLPERKAVFIPYENKISKQELHLTQMKIWNIINRHGIVPFESFGTIIMKDGLNKKYIFEGAGGYVALSHADDYIENTVTLPAGKYVCMYKYGMPYDTEFLYKLIRWINDNNYKIVGNIVDACLLDTTFYDESNNVDLCQLQIPIEKIC